MTPGLAAIVPPSGLMGLVRPRTSSCCSSIRDLHLALLLNARGRIRLPANREQWLAQATAPLREAPFSHEIVLAAQQVPLPHRDPADRFLAATAQIMDLTLVTSDDLMLGLGTIRTMKN